MGLTSLETTLARVVFFYSYHNRKICDRISSQVICRTKDKLKLWRVEVVDDFYCLFMLEVTGDIFNLSSWSYQPRTSQIAICIPTNGIVKANGRAVMGAGVAKAGSERYPQTPVILGDFLNQSGNQIYHLLTDGNVHLLSFPTKHHWRDPSDLALIINSARTLAEIACFTPDCTFVLTRPGCGCGGLSWFLVKDAIASLLPDNCWIIDLPR